MCNYPEMPGIFEKYLELTEFTYAGRRYAVEQTGSLAVAKGVVCDTYSVDITDDWDLGIIKIDAGCQTPRQRVVGGTRTIEMYLMGEGHLSVASANASAPDIHPFKLEDLWTSEGEEIASGRSRSVDVGHGDVMQWTASGHMALMAAELCWPPYEDGRFIDLP